METTERNTGTNTYTVLAVLVHTTRTGPIRIIGDTTKPEVLEQIYNILQPPADEWRALQAVLQQAEHSTKYIRAVQIHIAPTRAVAVLVARATIQEATKYGTVQYIRTDYSGASKSENIGTADNRPGIYRKTSTIYYSSTR